MKQAFLIIALAALAACNNAAPKPEKKTTAPSARSLAMPVVKYGVEGLYTGAFVPEKFREDKEVFENKITIFIDSLDGNTLYGHSVVAGNERPFKGTCTKEGGLYSVQATEPGDNRYDGRFSFTIDPEQKSITGRWMSNNATLAVTERSYELKQRSYKYDPALSLPEGLIGDPIYNSYLRDSDSAEALTSDVLIKNASATLLKSADVENMYKADLEVLRNAIYARHGYSFKNPRMRLLFDYVDWYMPVSTNVTHLLTEVENKNIALIKRYEAHAEKYYDAFGR